MTNLWPFKFSSTRQPTCPLPPSKSSELINEPSLPQLKKENSKRKRKKIHHVRKIRKFITDETTASSENLKKKKKTSKGQSPRGPLDPTSSIPIPPTLETLDPSGFLERTFFCLASFHPPWKHFQHLSPPIVISEMEKRADNSESHDGFWLLASENCGWSVIEQLHLWVKAGGLGEFRLFFVVLSVAI